MASGSARQSPQQPTRDTSALPAASATTAAPAGTHERTRTYMPATPGRPVKRARVVLIAAAGLSGGRADADRRNGRVRLRPGLPAGRYTITASKSGYIQLSARTAPAVASRRRRFNCSTDNSSRASTSNCRAAASSPGRVSDESGDVMPGVMVSVQRYPSTLQGDRRRLTPAGQAQRPTTAASIACGASTPAITT